MTPYIGEIRMYAGTKPPENWAICDGHLLPVNDYYELYMLIGTTYGGDGHSTFAVPDLRGRAPIGVGAGPGLTPINLNDRVGAEFSAVKAENLPAHTHVLQAAKAVGNNADPKDLMMATIAGTTTVYVKDAAKPDPDPLPIPTPAAMGSTSISMTGNANASVSVVQPFMAINFIVSIKGLM